MGFEAALLVILSHANKDETAYFTSNPKWWGVFLLATIYPNMSLTDLQYYVMKCYNRYICQNNVVPFPIQNHISNQRLWWITVPHHTHKTRRFSIIILQQSRFNLSPLLTFTRFLSSSWFTPERFWNTHWTLGKCPWVTAGKCSCCVIPMELILA